MKRTAEKTQPGFFRSIAAAAALAVVLASTANAQTLLHRYSFVSDLTDSVGGATGTTNAPSGGSPITVANGLTLPGGGGPGFSGYVSLPSGILNATASLTIECWATQNSQQTWAELYNFNNGQSQYTGFIPYPANNNNNASLAFKNGGESDAASGIQFPNGVETYITETFDTNTLIGRLYTNGTLIGSTTVPNASYTPGSMNLANNWLGQDPFPDPQFQGTIYEFRIWNGVVSQRYLQASAVAGPGTIINNLTPSSATLTAGATVVLGGAESATFTVTLPQTGSTVLQATSDATNWTSSNPGVLIVSSNGFIEGVGLGTATVSAKVAGVSATSGTITVVNPQLLHRYSFVSDASDSVGGANGTIVPPGATNGTSVTISNGLTLPGGGGPGFSGYVSLPQGVLNGAPSLTVECWATQTTQNTWAELYSFNNGTAQYLALIPFPANNGENMVMALRSGNNEYDADAGVKFPVGVQTYIAETFNAYSLQGALYTNGSLIATTTAPDTSFIPASWNTANNVLGQDPYPDSQFQGTIAELRVWDGVVSPLYLQVSTAAGPTIVVTNLVPTTLNVNLTTTSMIGSGTQQATVIGNFPQISSVNVTTGATNWTSSNPTILTVNSSGLITAVNGGTATVSATVAGVTATSATITVATTAPTFSQRPSNQTAAVGDTVTLSAVALGGSLSYQWSLNSSPLSGATNATLVLSNIQLNQAGTYNLVVTNTQGTTNTTATVSIFQAILEHRYSFATDASDSVGGANGTNVPPNGGGAATISSGLILPGNTGGGFGVSGYVALPPGSLTNTTSVTIECWATQTSANTWATIWDFADNGNINFELCPFPNRNGGNMITAFTPNGGEADLNTAVSFPNGSEQYVALTVNGGTLLSQLYTNGTLVGGLTLPNSTYLPRNIGGNGGTLQNMLGNDTYGDEQFSGTIYEFRIWDGAVTPLYLAISSVAGPSVVVTSTTPSSIAVSLSTTTMIGGQNQNATATGTFPQASGIPLNSFVTNWSSSNPSAVTVDSNGVVTAVGVGTATVSAMVNGSTGTSAMITVQTSLPVITQEPIVNETLLAGATLRAIIANEGTPPFTYRWYRSSGPTLLSTSTTTPSLSVPNLTLSSADNYYCVVSNQYGTATSSNLVLSVVTPTTYQGAVLSYSPTGFWPLNESSGTTAYDVVGGNNGTYEGGYTLGVGGPGSSFFAGNSAANFDGNIAHVDIPGGLLNISNAVTVTAWLQLSGLNGFDGVVGHGDSSWRMTVDGSAIPAGNDGSPPADAYNAAVNVNDGNWHMLAYTYNGFTNQNFNGRLYLDGNLIASNSVFATPAGNNLDMWIGGSPDYGTNTGKRIIAANMADVAVFAEGFTGAQITALYNGTFVASPTGLTLTRSGGSTVLNWQEGLLLQAPSVRGPWTTNFSAAPPYTVPTTNSSQFFRLLINPD